MPKLSLNASKETKHIPSREILLDFRLDAGHNLHEALHSAAAGWLPGASSESPQGKEIPIANMEKVRISVLGHESGQCQCPKAIQVKIVMGRVRVRHHLLGTCRQPRR